MASRSISSLLRSVDFVPQKVEVRPCGKDRFGRQLYRPMVDGTMSGSRCVIIPVDLGLYSSVDEAIADAVSWAQLV